MKIATAVFLALAGLSLGCDIDVKDKGKLPDVDVTVTPGRTPDVDVRGPEVDITTKDTKVTVPDIDVNSKEVDVKVPAVDIKVPEENDNE